MRRSFNCFFLTAAMAILIVFNVMPFQAFAQDASDTNGGKSILFNGAQPMNTLKSLSLLDPDRFTMRNQYMMSFSSSGGNGSLMGMYINTMEYRFNSPLVMRLRLAYQSQTGHLFGNKDAFTGNPNIQDGRLFIPSFDLEYRPFKNTTISFHYRDNRSFSPYYGYGGYGYGSRFYRRGYSPFMMW